MSISVCLSIYLFLFIKHTFSTVDPRRNVWEFLIDVFKWFDHNDVDVVFKGLSRNGEQFA